MRKKNQKLNTRAGSAPNRINEENKFRMKSPCILWRGRAYQELRKEMYFNGRQNIPGCEFCDIFGLYNYLPSSAKSNEFKRLADEISLRKNFGMRYVFDTMPLSKNIFERFKICGVEFDGLINVRGDEADANYKFVTFQQALSERAFIFVPTIFYDDGLFDFLHGAGYYYGKDYLIYTPDI